jgi:hypothetical protein
LQHHQHQHAHQPERARAAQHPPSPGTGAAGTSRDAEQHRPERGQQQPDCGSARMLWASWSQTGEKSMRAYIGLPLAGDERISRWAAVRGVRRSPARRPVEQRRRGVERRVEEALQFARRGRPLRAPSA